MVLVTGATGHIGNVLVKKLYAAGEDIRVLVPAGENVETFDGMRLQILCGDVRNYEDVERAVSGCALVYHLAGIIDISPKKVDLMYAVNVGGTKNVVKACLKCKVGRLVYVSSVHALPELPRDQIITESVALNGETLDGDYAKSKSLATSEVYKGIAQGLDAVILFPSGVIGPYDYKMSEFGKVLFGRIKKMNRRSWYYFDGAYDFVDVRDVADAIINAASLGECGEGYLLSGEYFSVRQMFLAAQSAMQVKSIKLRKVSVGLAKFGAGFLERISGLFGKKPFFTRYSVRVLLSNANMSNEKAKSKLGFKPRSIDQSIKDSVCWLNENRPQKKRKRLHGHNG